MKEKVFIGKKAGKIYVAEFVVSEGGRVRELPIESMSVGEFEDRLRGGYDVKGFSIGRSGEIETEYGTWGSLEDVGEEGYSTFGLVELCVRGEGEEGVVGYKGIASVEFSTGRFRVLAPSTYGILSKLRGVTVYRYPGVDVDLLGTTGYSEYSYMFSRCEGVEGIEDIKSWLGVRGYEGEAYAFMQEVTQRCEALGCRELQVLDIVTEVPIQE